MNFQEAISKGPRRGHGKACLRRAVRARGQCHPRGEGQRRRGWRRRRAHDGTWTLPGSSPRSRSPRLQSRFCCDGGVDRGQRSDFGLRL